VLFGVIILSLYHPAFLILAAIITIIITAFFKYSGPKGLSTSMQESKYKFKVAYWLQEVGRALRSFKLAGDSTLPVERTNELTVSYLKSRNAHFQVLIRQYRVLILVKLILAGMLIVIGSVLVINNMINIGQFVAAEIIILLLINSIEKIILNMSTVYDVLTSLDKLGGALDLTLERNSGIPLPDSDTAALTLEISDLQFQFDDAQKPLLSGVQLRVKSGETICIQGDDGSGKTTLIRLLSGYYEDYSGTIAYNQLSLKAIELQSLRAQIGENFSENEIFAGSILDNISCGRPSIDRKAAMDALHKVELKNWFMHQPQGLETLLTPEGQGLPGHIRRRLMLARIFAGKPRLLLIEDSPMMQSQNERQLFYQLLFAHCKDITTIVISNDPSISSRCMQTYVLQNGQLIPQTTHS
jgi:ABC-type bacteriocin/lantibiotic exporter with double-glycine peptidase domain